MRDADRRVDSPWDDAWNQIRSDLRYVFFPPGDYKVFVQAKVGIDKSPLEAGYTTFSEVANVRVAAPQFVIGFVAQYLGKSALDKLLPGRPASRAPQSAPATPPRQLREPPVEHEVMRRDGTHG